MSHLIFISRNKNTRSFLRKIAFLSFIFFLFIAIYLLTPLKKPLFKDDYSLVVESREGKILRAFLNNQDQWQFSPLKSKEIPQNVKKVLVFFEDKYFYYHFGVNPLSIFRAFYQNIFSTRSKSGASTLSMQVIRMAYPRKRTIINKIIESLSAIKLELNYSKDEILALYLNHAPFGGNIRGIGAASLSYYDKKVGDLTWSQAAVLSILPNAPSQLSPFKNKNKLLEKRNRLLKRLNENGFFDDNTLKSSLNEPLPDKRGTFLNSAPHICREFKRQSLKGYQRSTIDYGIQTKIERLIKNYGETINYRGIGNAAAMVVNTKTLEVVAYCGSCDFFDKKNFGEIDGCKSFRSSGSTFKPFLYGAAFDKGLILPSSQLRDVPVFYATFSPLNADYMYRGLVSVKDALVNSLNVPAVNLLSQYGHKEFYNLLKKMGVDSLFRTADNYGLTLILGGSEVSLKALAGMYAILGNYGVYKPLIYRLNNKEKKSRRIISGEASYLTLNILKELKRPGKEFFWSLYQGNFPVAWKTGTSYGQRDAWAVSVTPQWVVAVWAGNFNGDSNSNLSGVSTAAPLMFQILNSIHSYGNSNWFEKKGLDFQKVKVCDYTGFPAGKACPKKHYEIVPKFTSSPVVCPYHKFIFLSKDRKMEVCSQCYDISDAVKKSFLYYPPEVLAYIRESKGYEQEKIPKHNIDCPAYSDSQPKLFKLVYPTDGAKIWVPRDFKGEQKVTVFLAHSRKNSKIYWYVDKEYIGYSIEQHRKSLSFSIGEHKLYFVDDNGQSIKSRLIIYKSKK